MGHWCCLWATHSLIEIQLWELLTLPDLGEENKPANKGSCHLGTLLFLLFFHYLICEGELFCARRAISWVGRWCSAGRALRYSPAGKDCFLCEEQLIFPLFFCVQRSLCCIQRIPGPALPQSWGRTSRRGNEAAPAAPAGAGRSRKMHTGTESQNPEGWKRLSGSSAPTPPCPPLKPLLK